MKFRYYIADPETGNLGGTNSTEIADDFSHHDTFFVVDTEKGKWLTGFGEEIEIEEIKNNEEAAEGGKDV